MDILLNWRPPAVTVDDLKNSNPFVPFPVWEECRKLYAVGKRAYHAFDHALDVLWTVQLAHRVVGFVDYEAAAVAALFHDCVYVAGAPTGHNEEDSIQAMFSLAARPNVNFSRALADRAKSMIVGTAEHGSLTMNLGGGNLVAGLRWDVALFMDCDMAGFAAAPERFDVQNKNIDEEFKGVVEPDAYRKGRSRFLQGLQKKGVFLTPPFVREGEARAQANLVRELSRVETWMTR